MEILWRTPIVLLMLAQKIRRSVTKSPAISVLNQSALGEECVPMVHVHVTRDSQDKIAKSLTLAVQELLGLTSNAAILGPLTWKAIAVQTRMQKLITLEPAVARELMRAASVVETPSLLIYRGLAARQLMPMGSAVIQENWMNVVSVMG